MDSDPVKSKRQHNHIYTIPVIHIRAVELEVFFYYLPYLLLLYKIVRQSGVADWMCSQEIFARFRPSFQMILIEADQITRFCFVLAYHKMQYHLNTLYWLQCDVLMYCYNTEIEWKKALGETKTLCTGRSNAEPKIFTPPQTPSRGVGRPKFNQLEMVTTFTYRPSLVKIDAWNFELPDPQTINARPPIANTQTGPITIHCTAKHSAQCK